MELRNILYGYDKRQFEFSINEKEAVTVRRIFEEYLSGRTLLQIANSLTDDQIVYYKERTDWSKQMVRRIIENKHYTGDSTYPEIIDKATYRKANKMRLEKGGDREKDTPEVHYFKYHTFCEQCGKRYTRRSVYSKNREKWLCSNGCKIPVYYDDEEFYKVIIAIVNTAIADPTRLMLPHKEEELYSPTIKVQRDERTLNNMASQESLKFQSVKKAYFDLLAEQFDCCEMDGSYAVTDSLIDFLGDCETISDVDVELFKTILSEIRIDGEGMISVVFMNGAVIKGGNLICEQ